MIDKCARGTVYRAQKPQAGKGLFAAGINNEKGEAYVFKMLNLGNMDNNCYILGDDKSKHALLIDAPAEAGAVLDVLEEEGLKLKFIL